jgi:hypothetical protein
MKIKKISPHENSTPRKINFEIASNFLTVHLILFVFLAECAANLQENGCSIRQTVRSVSHWPVVRLPVLATNKNGFVLDVKTAFRRSRTFWQ